MPKSNLDAEGTANVNTETKSTTTVTHEPLDNSYLTDVEGDAKYHYFWASTQRTHPQSVDQMKRLGYEVVPENSSENTPFADNKDGGRVVGDLILMRMPKERADDLRRRRREAFHRRLQATEEKMLRTGANVDGVENTVTENNSPSERSFFFFSNNPLAK